MSSAAALVSCQQSKKISAKLNPHSKSPNRYQVFSFSTQLSKPQQGWLANTQQIKSSVLAYWLFVKMSSAKCLLIILHAVLCGVTATAHTEANGQNLQQKFTTRCDQLCGAVKLNLQEVGESSIIVLLRKTKKKRKRTHAKWKHERENGGKNNNK